MNDEHLTNMDGMTTSGSGDQPESQPELVIVPADMARLPPVETADASPPLNVKRKSGKGPRPKHVPIRTCLGCRDRDAKRALIRIVRTPEGAVAIDPKGKKNGRGAYLCTRSGCWERALTTGGLGRALRTEIDTVTIEMLHAHASTLTDDSVATATTQERTMKHG